MNKLFILLLLIPTLIQAQVPSFISRNDSVWKYDPATRTSILIYPVGAGSASFASITGQPADNANLSTALSGKQPTISTGTAAQYLKGDLTLGTYTGYTLFVQSITSSPADNVTSYFGNLPKGPVTTAGTSKVYIRRAGTISIAEIYCYAGTAGTTEAWSLYVRVNNTTDYLIATVSAATNERVFSNTALSIPVVAGDYIEIKSTSPIWATNPLTVIFGGSIYIN